MGTDALGKFRWPSGRTAVFMGKAARFIGALLVLFSATSPVQALDSYFIGTYEWVDPLPGLSWINSLYGRPDVAYPSLDDACKAGSDNMFGGNQSYTYTYAGIIYPMTNYYGAVGAGACVWDYWFAGVYQGIYGHGYVYNAMSCPVPTVNPTLPYQWDWYSTKCFRRVQETFTIAIEPSGTYLPTNGTYTILPSTVLPLYAVVKDQNGVVQAGKQVSLTVNVQTLDVQSGTIGVLNGEGGHLHTVNRPKGSFACSSVYAPGSETATCTLTTDSNGQAPFIFIPTAVSGAHTITASCTGCSSTTTAPVNVKVSDLITIPASLTLYALSDSKGVIGAIPGKHTDNHYLTSTAITKLKELASIYTAVNPGAKLYLNDASLVWGGLFDVGTTPWVPPHSLHDTGVSLDIRAANSGPNNEGSVPATLFPRFIKDAKKKGFKIGLHCKNSSDTNYCLGQPNNRHFHVDF